MKPLQVSRRRFIQLALGVGLTGVIGARPVTLPDHAQHPLITQLATLLPHQQSARLIGQRYLQRYPQEAELRLLLTTITATLDITDPTSLPQQLAQQISADFAAEKTVKVQGWVLAHTEARLCALAALMVS